MPPRPIDAAVAARPGPWPRPAVVGRRIVAAARAVFGVCLAAPSRVAVVGRRLFAASLVAVVGRHRSAASLGAVVGRRLSAASLVAVVGRRPFAAPFSAVVGRRLVEASLGAVVGRCLSAAVLVAVVGGGLAAVPRGAVAADAPASCPPAAEPLTPASLEAGLRDARDHGFLWRISKSGRSSYLYGTIHAARREWMFPGPTVAAAIADSDVVALELDALDPGVQSRLAQAVRATGERALPAPLRERLERRRAAECVDAETFGRFSPEFQVASLMVLAARREGLDPSYAVDLMLAVVARRQGKSVVSLETPEGQMAALQMPDAAATVAFVEASLDDIESGRARPLVARLARAWSEGDYADLARYDDWCDCRGTEAERLSMQRLLDDRNPGLAESIDALHAGGARVFAAVGSLHLFGPLGLPALLKLRGYTVEQGDIAAPAR